MLRKLGTSMTSNKLEAFNRARDLGRRPGETRTSPLRAAGSRWCREAHAANALDSVDLWPSALGRWRKLRTLALGLRRGRLRRRGGIPGVRDHRQAGDGHHQRLVDGDSGQRVPCGQTPLRLHGPAGAGGLQCGRRSGYCARCSDDATLRAGATRSERGFGRSRRVVRCPERDWRAGRVPLDVRRRVRPGRRSAEARGRSLSVGRAGARCA
jgi:hypothetical protein